MDPIHILIRLTGLLLLTPDTPDGQLPLHVLMPATAEAHVAQIGFRGPRESRCAYYDAYSQVCYLSMDGWSVEIGTRAATPGRFDLPTTVADLSTPTQRRVSRRLFGADPGPALRGRLDIHGGRPGDDCALATWQFMGGRRPLANVVTWVMDWNEPTLTIHRTALVAGGPDDAPITLRPMGGTIELFVRQVPKAEEDRDGHVVPGRAMANDSVRHFDAIYDLLGVTDPGLRAIPTSPVANPANPVCAWAGAMAGAADPPKVESARFAMYEPVATPNGHAGNRARIGSPHVAAGSSDVLPVFMRWAAGAVENLTSTTFSCMVTRGIPEN